MFKLEKTIMAWGALVKEWHFRAGRSTWTKLLSSTALPPMNSDNDVYHEEIRLG